MARVHKVERSMAKNHGVLTRASADDFSQVLTTYDLALVAIVGSIIGRNH
jgi:hypothetical protein